MKLGVIALFLAITVGTVCSRRAITLENKNFPVIFPGDGDDATLKVPGNLCDYFANDQDLSNAGLNGAVGTFCQQQLGQYPAQVHVNADDNPYKMCLVAGDAQFGNLQPNTAIQIIAQDSFNNTTNQTITHSFSLTGSYTQSLEVSTTNTVSLSVSVEYSVELPEVFSEKFSMSTAFSSSTTKTNRDQTEVSFNPTTITDCLPHCVYIAVESINTAIYKSTMTVPLCLSGWARCQYNDRVNGHYYWYVMIDDFVQTGKRCYTQQGLLSSVVCDVKSSTTMSDKCY